MTRKKAGVKVHLLFNFKSGCLESGFAVEQRHYNKQGNYTCEDGAISNRGVYHGCNVSIDVNFRIFTISRTEYDLNQYQQSNRTDEDFS